MRSQRMIRSTQQRREIRAAFEKIDRPLSPQEVLTVVARRVPGIGVATVYRTIKGMVEDKTLKPVELPGEPARYEIAGKAHHHHFRCRACARVFELNGCPGNMNKLLPRGFRLEDHEIILFGLCSRCAA